MKIVIEFFGKLFELVKQATARSVARRNLVRNKLRTVSGRGLRPGVDLDKSADLLDIMEPTEMEW